MPSPHRIAVRWGVAAGRRVGAQRIEDGRDELFDVGLIDLLISSVRPQDAEVRLRAV
jgi:hypothetical protein